MKAKRLKIMTMDDIENFKVDRQFVYSKQTDSVLDRDGRGYFNEGPEGFIKNLHHLCGRKNEWGPIYDLLEQYLTKNNAFGNS